MCEEVNCQICQATSKPLFWGFEVARQIWQLTSSHAQRFWGCLKNLIINFFAHALKIAIERQARNLNSTKIWIDWLCWVCIRGSWSISLRHAETSPEMGHLNGHRDYCVPLFLSSTCQLVLGVVERADYLARRKKFKINNNDNYSELRSSCNFKF